MLKYVALLFVYLLSSFYSEYAYYDHESTYLQSEANLTVSKLRKVLSPGSTLFFVLMNSYSFGF